MKMKIGGVEGFERCTWERERWRGEKRRCEREEKIYISEVEEFGSSHELFSFGRCQHQLKI